MTTEAPKKTSKSVTSGLGEKLMAELDAAATITGQSKAELVRVVFERYAPTRREIASAFLERQKKEIEVKLGSLAEVVKA